MSDLDALAETARNRGLKLVRSRVRTPGKRGFGKVGLVGAARKPVFGMDAKGPTANPEEVADYLRSVAASDWGASLDAPAPKRKAEPAAKVPKPRPPPPEPAIRDARPSDASAMTALIAQLGAEFEAAGVRKRIALLAKTGAPALVATLGKDVVGLCGLHVMPALHRERPVGRVNVLVVGTPARGKGIGRLLMAAAEDRLTRLGCELIEITSNDRLTEAHAFYRHLGYERTSVRFAKTL